MTIAPLPATGIGHPSTNPLDAARQEVARASSRLQAINAETDRLAIERAKVMAEFNFACARLAELQNKLHGAQ
jgi:hypothetical protein